MSGLRSVAIAIDRPKFTIIGATHTGIPTRLNREKFLQSTALYLYLSYRSDSLALVDCFLSLYIP